jgi:hypothetical protein
MKLYLPETDFLYSKYSVLNVIRCHSWHRKTHRDNLVTNPIKVLTPIMPDVSAPASGTVIDADAGAGGPPKNRRLKIRWLVVAARAVSIQDVVTQLFPKKAIKVMDSLSKNERTLVWKVVPTLQPLGETQTRNVANLIGAILNAAADQSAAKAGQILAVLLSRSIWQDVRTILFDHSLFEGELHSKIEIANSVIKFVSDHRKRGGKKDEVRVAIDAVMVAALGPNNKSKNSVLVKMLGYQDGRRVH